ncbi:hypothetical protein [Clostridium sp. DJ247]|uniref:hypothetical protein n=1 Tax=Clostridium sp. DJ247 TaxID=2726188 RepID=UPI001626E8B7|nr:hypothetical protein [Clostridium sp. DJ247]MBC2581034.1 hypothetical protein [Clostridium sp. DJ247]
MDLENIVEALNDVNIKIQNEYNKWNLIDDIDLIEECIWNIKSLEIRRGNLYRKAKALNNSHKEVV